MKQVVILGAGLVGRVMAIDLSDRYQVIALDNSAETLAALAPTKVEARQCDVFADGVLEAETSSADLVINALPGSIGFQALSRLCAAGKQVVDIAFFGEDPRSLTGICNETGGAVVYDCGVSPGLSNFWIAEAAGKFESLQSLEILVGGLPVERRYPYEYAAVFSPSDVIEEYVRPARFVLEGKLQEAPALSGPEFIEVPGVGTLEAFFTDGMRSLLHTLECPNLIEKTLRYPGHRERMLFLREAGFFDEEPRQLSSGLQVSPREVTESLFREAWKLGDGEREFTYLKVTLSGQVEGSAGKRSFEMIDYTDSESGTSSMARTTGYTATAAASYLLENGFPSPGVFAPEELGRAGVPFASIRSYLSDRSVELREF